MSLNVDERPISTATRTRNLVERLLSERGGRAAVGPPARPHTRRLCTAGAAAASAEARSSAPHPWGSVKSGWAHGQVGRFSQRGRTGDPDGFPCWSPPGASRVRTAWPETAVGPPARPGIRRLCPASARRAPRRPRPGHAFRLVSGCPHGADGRSSHMGRSVLPGDTVGRPPSGCAFRRARWPGPAAGVPRGRPVRAERPPRRAGGVMPG